MCILLQHARLNSSMLCGRIQGECRAYICGQDPSHIQTPHNGHLNETRWHTRFHAYAVVHPNNENRQESPMLCAQQVGTRLVRKSTDIHGCEKSKKVEIWKRMWDEHCSVGVNRISYIIILMYISWRFPRGKEHIKENVYNQKNQQKINSVSLFSGKCY